MFVKTILDEDFVNYKQPSMFIGCRSCSFKCDQLYGSPVCQNHELANMPDVNITSSEIVKRFCDNPLTQAIVFGGLEPFDDINHIVDVVAALRYEERRQNLPHADVVIYSGYTEDEVRDRWPMAYAALQWQRPVIIKYGRFIPDQQPHFDSVLGVDLASDNQYAVEI